MKEAKEKYQGSICWNTTLREQECAQLNYFSHRAFKIGITISDEDPTVEHSRGKMRSERFITVRGIAIQSDKGSTSLHFGVPRGEGTSHQVKKQVVPRSSARRLEVS